jgi:phosphatidylglycerophosphatase A
MKKKSLKWHKIFATVGGVGRLPIAPGTWGAAVGTLCLVPFMGTNHQFLLHIVIFASSVFLTWLGAKVAHDLEPEWGEDPKQYVMDEFVGVWIAIIGHAFTPIHLFLSFLLFRIFDIWKPFGIRKLENVPNGWGVMLDDVAAGVAANITLWGIHFLLEKTLHI